MCLHLLPLLLRDLRFPALHHSELPPLVGGRQSSLCSFQCKAWYRRLQYLAALQMELGLAWRRRGSSRLGALQLAQTQGEKEKGAAIGSSG